MGQIDVMHQEGQHHCGLFLPEIHSLNHEETSDRPKLRDSPQNSRPTLFKNGNVRKDQKEKKKKKFKG